MLSSRTSRNWSKNLRKVKERWSDSDHQPYDEEQDIAVTEVRKTTNQESDVDFAVVLTETTIPTAAPRISREIAML